MRHARTRRSRTAIALCAMVPTLFVACASDEDTGTAPPPIGSITVGLSAPGVTVSAGSTGGVTVSVTRTQFTGTVNLLLENAPQGVSATFDPTSMPTGTASSSLAISVASLVAPGTYTLTVRGRGQGVNDNTATLTLTVPVVGGFSLSVAPSVVTVQQNGTVMATAAIVRTGGFAGAVALTVSGTPTGVTVVPSPTSVAGTLASLAVTTAAAVTGSYPVTVRGTAPGLPDQTATLTVQVTTGTGGISVTMQFCGSDTPTWVAAKSDAANWERLTAGPGDRYTFTVGSRGAIAALMPTDDGLSLTVIHATATELEAFASASIASCGTPTSGSKHLTGSVAGVGPQQVGSIAIGDATAEVEGAGTPSFTIDDAPDAASDLVAVRQSVSSTGFRPDRIIVRRSVNLPNGATIPTLNFGASEAFAPYDDVVTLDGLGSDWGTVVNTIYTAAGTALPLSIQVGPGMGYWHSSVPPERMLTGDIHEVTAFAASPTGGDRLRGVALYARVFGPFGLILGPSLATPTMTTVSASPPQRLRVEAPRQNEYSGSFAVVFEQGAAGGSSRSVSLHATGGYFASSPQTWDVTIPDLSAAGFDAAWGLAPGAPVSLTTIATSSPTFLIMDAVPPEGTEVHFAMRGDLSSVLGAGVSPVLSFPRIRPFSRVQTLRAQTVPRRLLRGRAAGEPSARRTTVMTIGIGRTSSRHLRSASDR